MIGENDNQWYDIDCFIWRQSVVIIAGFLSRDVDSVDQSKIIIRAINDLDPHKKRCIKGFPSSKEFAQVLITRGHTILKTMDYDVSFPSMLLDYSEYVEKVVQIVKNSCIYVK